MATITFPHPNGVSAPPILQIEPTATSQLQSLERQKLAVITDGVLRDLIVKQKQYLETLENSDEIEYNPVPPKRLERVIMRAQFKGRKKPLPYIFDEE